MKTKVLCNAVLYNLYIAFAHRGNSTEILQQWLIGTGETLAKISRTYEKKFYRDDFLVLQFFMYITSSQRFDPLTSTIVDALPPDIGDLELSLLRQMSARSLKDKLKVFLLFQAN